MKKKNKVIEFVVVYMLVLIVILAVIAIVPIFRYMLTPETIARIAATFFVGFLLVEMMKM